MVVWHEHNVPKGCQFSAKSLVHCSRSCETVTKHDRDQLFRSFLELVRNHSVWFCINCETFPDEQQEVWHFPLCFQKPFLGLSQASQEVLWIWHPPFLDILFSSAIIVYFSDSPCRRRWFRSLYARLHGLFCRWRTNRSHFYRKAQLYSL